MCVVRRTGCSKRMEIAVAQQRYSESQVLYGLREAWPEFTGVDDPFDADTHIDTYMKADDTWDEIDFADVFRGIERFFDFHSPDSEWTAFFGFDVAKRSMDEWDRTVAPNLTFGALAGFVAKRAPVVASFDAISVLGRPCAPAGVFTGIRRVADHATGNRLRFPPSARVIDVIRGHDLDSFWTQLRWMTEHSTPELPAFWRNVTGVAGCLGILATAVALIATWATSNPVGIIPTLLVALVCYTLASAYRRLANPLPPHIVTFRDLSMLIATART